MYFWRDDLLFEDLQRSRVPEKDFLRYYLATSAVYVISMWVLDASTVPVTVWDHLEYGMILFFLIGGTSLAFKCYGPRKYFVERLVALSFPLMVKMLLLGIAAGTGMALLHWDTPAASAALSLVLQCWFYHRLIRHMVAFTE